MLIFPQKMLCRQGLAKFVCQQFVAELRFNDVLSVAQDHAPNLQTQLADPVYRPGLQKRPEHDSQTGPGPPGDGKINVRAVEIPAHVIRAMRPDMGKRRTRR
jgi:hypothetical protein